MADDDATSTSGSIEPRLAQHGRVAYVEIPARDPITSAVFYEAVFGWTITPPVDERVASTLGPRDNARISFSDTADGLFGAFVAGRAPSEDGVVIFVYVADIAGVLREIEARGGEIVRPLRPEGNLQVAEFRDPGGNVIGVWEAAEG